MARKAAGVAVLSGPSDRVYKALRLTLTLFAVTATLFMAAAAYSQVEQLLISDPRFRLPGPSNPGERSPYVQIEGLHYASEEQILQVFARDFERSLYLCPISERRIRLLAIDWVKDASVSRIWPNRLVVHITERQPVAFAQLRVADGTLRYGLIDEDGVLLNPRVPRRLKLPVLTGFPHTDTEEKRRERVRQFLRMKQEIGPTLMQNISEINAGDLDNLKVTQLMDGHAVVLMMGNRDFRSRLENFISSYGEIQTRHPKAAVLDLRFTGRIIVGQEDRDGR